jgi:hypothetical protein
MNFNKSLLRLAAFRRLHGSSCNLYLAHFGHAGGFLKAATLAAGGHRMTVAASAAVSVLSGLEPMQAIRTACNRPIR